MKRSAFISLSLIGSAFLISCDRLQDIYFSDQDCSHSHPLELCRKSHQKALQDYHKYRPQFRSQEMCLFQYKRCSYVGEFFIPDYWKFNYENSEPVYERKNRLYQSSRLVGSKPRFGGFGHSGSGFAGARA